MFTAVKMKWGPLGLALLVLMALILWLMSGEVKTAKDEVETARDSADSGPVRVQTERLEAQRYRPELVAQGQVEAWRRVAISVQVDGNVVELPVEQGQAVSKGEKLLGLSEDERPAAVDRARARVKQVQADLAAADRLRADKLVSRSETLRLESELANARAELVQAELAQDSLTPRAPFDAIVNRREVELGSFVKRGQAVLELVQIERLKVTAEAPQQSVAMLAVGQPVTVELLDGGEMEGTLSFIASAADPSTRTFPLEATVDNPRQLRVAGSSATLRIGLEEVSATFISPAYLSLGDDGRMGVFHVDEDNIVRFTRVRLLRATTDGAWVTGLPQTLRLITQGGGFVSPGQKVEAVSPDQ